MPPVRCAVLLAAFVGVMAAPAAAAPRLWGLGGKPVPGFRLEVDRSGVSLFRGLPEAQELYRVRPHLSRYHARRDLSRARLRMDLGDHGQADLTFHATGKVRRVLPHGCHGPREPTRRGVLSGTFRLLLAPTSFAAIHRTRMRAALARPGYACGLPELPNDNDARRPIQLSRIAPDTQFAFDKAHGTVFESYWARERGASSTLTTSAIAIAPAADLTADMVAGTATVHGAPPFFGGTATFAPAPGEVYNPALGDVGWTGPLTGDLHVVLAGQAPRSLAVPAAELFQPCGCL